MGKSGQPRAARSSSDGCKGTDGWPELAAPVSPASAHVTPCGRPMRPPSRQAHKPVSWTDGQQSPRSKDPTGHVPAPYWRRLRGRPGSIKSHFAGSHVSPLTAADDVSDSTRHSLAFCSTRCLCVFCPMRGGPTGAASTLSETNHGTTNITNAG
ncbi:hypothetical protein MKX08_003588 [Trichoderma sp. CBMAI-0020]|nr:hypothetical protein MKX08_003588 [Trichoderma sp. CBMAI-0020]